MKRNIEVQWKSGIASGYTDVFPLDEFARLITDAERAHLVRGPRGGKHNARFRLKVTSYAAEMDYSAFPAYNKRHGMERGIMRFRFTDNARTDVESIWWNDQPVGAEAKVLTVKVSEASSLGELAVQTHRAEAKVLLRPGQIEFRRNLDLMYGSKCCITGCTVAWALEAAHIEPYRDKLSNELSNGLLLRRDIHALFDAGQLGIDPNSREVVLSPEARQWKGYSELHRTAALLSPQPGFEKHSPHKSILQKRWREFMKGTQYSSACKVTVTTFRPGKRVSPRSSLRLTPRCSHGGRSFAAQKKPLIVALTGRSLGAKKRTKVHQAVRPRAHIRL